MKLLTRDEFIIQANEKHCNYFDYSQVNFPVRLTEKITIIDLEFGPFESEVNRHLKGKVHPARANLKRGAYKKLSTDDFIARAHNKHCNLYDYSKVVYTSITKKVCIIDPEYGEFWQSPAGHLSGQGHPLRGKETAANKRRTSLSTFIENARKIHGTLYDYSKVDYVHCDKKVCIIDPEYGEFWQSPYQHLNSHGCPERTKHKKWDLHIDHIIPLSILGTPKTSDKWFKERPLFKFLNSEINLKKVNAKFNRDKSDYVLINEKKVNASTVRNNYDIIEYLIIKMLKVNPEEIIKADKIFIREYFNL